MRNSPCINIDVGSDFKIIDTGGVYSGVFLTECLNLKGIEYEPVIPSKIGMVGTVTASWYHCFNDDIVYLLKIKENNGFVFIAGRKEYLERINTIPEEFFSL